MIFVKSSTSSTLTWKFRQRDIRAFCELVIKLGNTAKPLSALMLVIKREHHSSRQNCSNAFQSFLETLPSFEEINNIGRWRQQDNTTEKRKMIQRTERRYWGQSSELLTSGEQKIVKNTQIEKTRTWEPSDRFGHPWDTILTQTSSSYILHLELFVLNFLNLVT